MCVPYVHFTFKFPVNILSVLMKFLRHPIMTLIIHRYDNPNIHQGIEMIFNEEWFKCILSVYFEENLNKVKNEYRKMLDNLVVYSTDTKNISIRTRTQYNTARSKVTKYVNAANLSNVFAHVTRTNDTLNRYEGVIAGLLVVYVPSKWLQVSNTYVLIRDMFHWIPMCIILATGIAILCVEHVRGRQSLVRMQTGWYAREFFRHRVTR